MSGSIDDGLVSERLLNSGSSNRRSGKPDPLPQCPALATSRRHACSPSKGSDPDAFLKDQLAPLEGATATKGTALQTARRTGYLRSAPTARMARLRRRFVPSDAWGSVCHSVIRKSRHGSNQSWVVNP